ncbi:hypothetical protein [Nitrosomonas halophila]|uniref:hypothetical protein n=1 Tax=Nitrosomonas halophila TaxID=44576 RepID=UPI0015A2A50D|nr:hypothetical protein [Nitrosomonas halophila]
MYSDKSSLASFVGFVVIGIVLIHHGDFIDCKKFTSSWMRVLGLPVPLACASRSDMDHALPHAAVTHSRFLPCVCETGYPYPSANLLE